MQKMKSMFLNASIATVGFATANSAFASLLDTETTATLTQAGTDGETVGKLIIGAVCVLAAVGIIIGLLRKV